MKLPGNGDFERRVHFLTNRAARLALEESLRSLPVGDAAGNDAEEGMGFGRGLQKIFLV